MRKYAAFATFVSLWFTGLLIAAEHRVGTAAELAKVSPTLQPGDVVVMADGTWTDAKIVLKAAGTAQQPITLRAQTPGKVVLTGTTSLVVEGEHLVVSGLYIKDAKAAKEGEGDGVSVPGSHCRLTECAMEGDTHKFFVHLIGTNNRVDHCFMAGKTSGEPTFQIEVPADHPDNDIVEYNHFGQREPLGRNGGETMRVGYSGQSMNVSHALVEHNLFDRCDGEIEIISSKSCENTYRYNTFLDCGGMLTLRHGNRCLVDSNFFIAHHKKESGGIRIIGEDHVIVNNYIDGVEKGAFWITSGVPNSKLVQYFQAKRCTIAFNTVVDSGGPYLDLAAGLGGAGRTLKPQDNTIANNLLSVGSHGKLLLNAENEGTGNVWTSNLVAPGEGVTPRAGVQIIDLKLAKGSDRLWHPAASSPAVGAAQGEFAKVAADIDGQPRPEKKDIGCDQLSDAPVKNRPLAASDVGPSWMKRTAGEPVSDH